MRQTLAPIVDGHEVLWVVLALWVVLVLVLWLLLVEALVLWVMLVTVVVVVTVTVIGPVLVEVLVVLWARAGKAIARPATKTTTVNATNRDRLSPTRERLTSLALFAAFIARLP